MKDKLTAARDKFGSTLGDSLDRAVADLEEALKREGHSQDDARRLAREIAAADLQRLYERMTRRIVEDSAG